HIVGGGSVLRDIFGAAIPQWLWTMIYVGAIGSIVFFGTRTVDHINMILISGVILSYFAFIAVSAEYVDFSLLAWSNWGKAWLALPILFTAFTFQVIIPTLMTYMERNVRKIRLAII